MSKRKKARIVVKVDVDETPEKLRLGVVRLRALADRLMAMAEKAEANK